MRNVRKRVASRPRVVARIASGADRASVLRGRLERCVAVAGIKFDICCAPFGLGRGRPGSEVTVATEDARRIAQMDDLLLAWKNQPRAPLRRGYNCLIFDSPGQGRV